MTEHLGFPIPSPAVFEQIGTRIERMQELLRAAEKNRRFGVVAIGVSQEFQNVFAAYRRKQNTPSGRPWFNFVALPGFVWVGS